MPLNQLLHDEQLTLIRAARAKDRHEAEGYRTRLAKLDDQISAFPLRNRSLAREGSSPTLASTQAVSFQSQLGPSRLAGIVHWAEVWGISRNETILRLIDRGIGQSSTLMRSS